MASILKVDQIQTAAGGTPTAADLGLNTTGSVLQVVQKVITTRNSITSTSLVDTTFTQAITLSSASNKVLVQFNSTVTVLGDTYFWTQLNRNSTGIFNANNSNANLGSGNDHGLGYSFSYLDTPGTTSVTYTVQARKGGASTLYIPGETDDEGTLTLIEIAG